MNKQNAHLLLTWLIAAVWLINGVYCKLLNKVPRHELIVARILGREYAHPITQLIGLSELLMAVLILSGFRKRQVAIFQILLVASMNLLEFLLARDLLLWGGFNAVFALLFICLIGFNQFVLAPQVKLNFKPGNS